MSEQQQAERTYGRSMKTYVLAGDRDSLETGALNEARKFFGTDVQVEITQDYTVHHYPENMADQRYAAHIMVREVL